MDINEKIIYELLKLKKKNKTILEKLKRYFAEKYQKNLPSHQALFKAYHKLLQNKRIKRDKELEEILKSRPIRSLSGIVNISVLTKPYGCPGKCLFCPTENGFPKSYLQGEPAADRAYQLSYDPYRQVEKRLEMLKFQNHPLDKVELRIIGGTWSFYPWSYRKWFVYRCFEAANNFFESRKRKTRNLKEAQKINEKARVKIVGISIETRPDFINDEEIKKLRELGVTMVELGVQTIFDEILKLNRTNLSSKIIASATKKLKDAGFKVLYHLMPNLYGSNLEKDLLLFKKIFEDQRFKPDWLKIYPTVILKKTFLYKLWRKGEYRPYTDKELKELLIKIKTILPYWVRVARIIRDIPAGKIVAGTKLSNLREIIQKEMKKRNLVCHCLRCREVRKNYQFPQKIFLKREDYFASDGQEIFLSYESKNREKVFSFLRLRIPDAKSQPIFSSLKNCSLIREIQTYGELVPVGEKKNAPQHRGLGKKLVKIAEKITQREFGLRRIAVIAGVGVRDYFRSLGYRLKDTYMIKNLV